jgi:hypothetical protein
VVEHESVDPKAQEKSDLGTGVMFQFSVYQSVAVKKNISDAPPDLAERESGPDSGTRPRLRPRSTN